MKISPIDIQNKQFKVKFRGFDIQEVDAFLEQTADTVEQLQYENKMHAEHVQRLERENKAFKEREDSLKATLVHTQKIIGQMKENARSTAGIIIADAEVKAEKMLNKAHQRLSQLHEDIAELKRQRMQIEIQIRSILESHTRLLEMGNAEREEQEEADEKVKLLRHTQP
ncbi:MAG: DivIVA domain-containing protein [Desulfobacterales bacterium]